jgi:ABC-type antimicrobial peptide transport system permease subunit
MLPVSIGIGIGLIAAIIAIRAFGSILFGLTVIDSAAFASAMLALGSLAALAAYLPARRASRMEASVALRYE